jgi:phospholipid/cholesterol/gamma-HCH transport system substrate-binding protein
VQRSVPSLGRVLTIAGFALSCFGLLLFLWVAFGGAVPFKPKGYRVQASFTDAATLAEQADVRISGVPIGKVVAKDLDPRGNATLATLEIDAKFAPLRTDTRAILRQKTLLGETYVELTPGSKRAPQLQDGARIRDAAIEPVVEFDELLRIFDPPTRKAFQQWQQTLAEATGGQAQDLSDALAYFPPFVEDAQSVVDILNRRRSELRGLVRGTGDTFEAITRNEGALSNLIVQQRNVFGELSDRREALADTFQVFPTFLRESRATIRRTTQFARDTDPLLRDLGPALSDLQPTIRSLRQAAPPVRRFFEQLGPLIDESRTGLPALSRVLRQTSPTLAAFGPFLEQVNPLLQMIELHQATFGDFLNTGASALKIVTPGVDEANKSNGHALPQLITTGSQSLPATTRTEDNRGNSYFGPSSLSDSLTQPDKLTLPSWDCGNTGGPKPGAAVAGPSCFVQEPFAFNGRTQRFPQARPATPAGAGTGGN